VKKRIFEPSDEVLGGLLPERFGVALAGKTKNNTQQMGPSPSALFDHPGPLAVIDLSLLAGQTLHPSERQRCASLQPGNEAFDRIIAAGKLMFTLEILMNPLSRQPQLKLGDNQLSERLAQTAPAGGGNGRV
jgi:hypothetical protein